MKRKTKCKKCGKTFGEIVADLISLDEHLGKAMVELKDKTCEELVHEYVTTIDFFHRKAAEILLLARGHVEIELGLK